MAEPMPLSDESADSDEDMTPKEFPQLELDMHTDSVCTVALHPTQPDIFATGGMDDKAFVIKGEEVFELAAHSDTVAVVKFSHAGEFLAVGSMDGTVSVWSLNSLTEPLKKLEGPDQEILALDWHPRGPVLRQSPR